MSIFNFFKSKQFFLSLIGAGLIVLVLAFGTLKFLDFYTEHNLEIEVPNLQKLKPEQAIERAESLGLELIILDTVDFEEGFPPLSVVFQDPEKNSFVKSGRKVYVKINAKNYSSVRLPNLMDNTLRFAIARIEALGLVKGKIIYQPHLAKDVIIQIEQDGRILKEGDKVLKKSKIDFVVGDGSLSYKPEPEIVDDIYEDVAPAIDSIY